MIFSSTYITGGRCLAIVTDTAMNTEVGKIAAMIETEKKSETPLQKRLAGLSALLGNITLCICALIFLLSLLRGMDID